MKRSWLWWVLLVVLLAVIGRACAQETPKDDAFSRLQFDRLAAKHADVLKYAAALQGKPTALKGLQDLRAVIHTHSFLSHDSRGTLEQMTAAAKATGTQVVMLSDHTSKEHDYYREGFKGMHDGVLFIPGAETRGFLVYPRSPLDPAAPPTAQALIDAVLKTGGVIFASHIEGWPENAWSVTNLTGTEAYNTHFELKRRPEFADLDRNPVKLLTLIKAVEKYPREGFGALQSYMKEYLALVDRETQMRRLTLVSANDSHANTGITIKGGENGKVVITDPLGEKLTETDAAMVRMLGISLPENLQPGQVGFTFLLDTYERSFGYTSTHLLAKGLDEDSVFAALKAGHTYLAFDWIAEPRGFSFALWDPANPNQPPAAIMGGQYPFRAGLNLQAAVPLPARLRLFRNGQPVPLPEPEALKSQLKFPLAERGVYRLEAWLPLGDEVLPWILSAPIYVQ